jgi:hypothetical protein
MKTKHNWRNIPDWAQYVAVDSYGQKMAFEREPHIHTGGFWVSYTGESCLIEQTESAEKWDNSLEKRPKVLGTKEEIEQIVKFILQDEDTDCGHEVLCSVIASRCAEQIMERLKLKP